MTLTIHDDLEQGSDAWLQARCGLLTASTIGKLITPTLKVADNDTARSLLMTLAAERITNHVEPTFTNAHMERGHRDEPIARDLYAETTGETVTEVGFMIREDNGIRLGFSPDGLVGDDGAIEIKSRLQKKQLKTVLDGKVPTENYWQVQAGLFVTGREWLDFISFSGGMHLWTVRATPDDEAHSAIANAVAVAEERIQEYVDRYNAATVNLPMTERVDDYDDIQIGA